MKDDLSSLYFGRIKIIVILINVPCFSSSPASFGSGNAVVITLVFTRVVTFGFFRPHSTLLDEIIMTMIDIRYFVKDIIDSEIFFRSSNSLGFLLVNVSERSSKYASYLTEHHQGQECTVL